MGVQAREGRLVPRLRTFYNVTYPSCNDRRVTEYLDRSCCRYRNAQEVRLVTPGDVVDLDDSMEDLYIVGTVAGFHKVTKIDGLQKMGSLSVRPSVGVSVHSLTLKASCCILRGCSS